MRYPKATQHIQSCFWQRYQTVSIAFAVTNMHALTHSIDVTDPQAQALAQAQAQAIERKESHTITEHAGRDDDLLQLGAGDDIG